MFFFFKQKTAYEMRISDWSSDVCSSDLLPSRRWSNNLEPILIYGFPLGSSMGLVAALEWLGKPDRLCRVDMLGEMREPAYARINARHETPEIGRASCRERVCQYV